MLKNVSLADQVFERLEQDILTGKYSRGDILTEAQICAEYGVSRTPVRTALELLEQEHIVESTMKGTMVLGVTEQDADDIYEIRRRVEVLAAAYCAKNITDEQLQVLNDILDYQELCVEKKNSEQVKALDSEFHTKLYEFSGSIVLYDTLVPLHRKIQKYRQRSVEVKSRARASNIEHRAIVEAIASRDPEKAEQAMLAHLTSAQRHLKEIKAI